jgi:hypothetical protein
MDSHLPVLGLTLQHERVLGLVNVIGVLVLDALDVGLGLDALVLGESALVTLLEGIVSIILKAGMQKKKKKKKRTLRA